jgi:hypothetical protein
MIYKIQKDSMRNPCAVQRTDDNGQVWSIPMDETNTDYQAYLKWLSEGNTPESAE